MKRALKWFAAVLAVVILCLTLVACGEKTGGGSTTGGSTAGITGNGGGTTSGDTAGGGTTSGDTAGGGTTGSEDTQHPGTDEKDEKDETDEVVRYKFTRATVKMMIESEIMNQFGKIMENSANKMYKDSYVEIKEDTVVWTTNVNKEEYPEAPAEVAYPYTKEGNHYTLTISDELLEYLASQMAGDVTADDMAGILTVYADETQNGFQLVHVQNQAQFGTLVSPGQTTTYYFTKA